MALDEAVPAAGRTWDSPSTLYTARRLKDLSDGRPVTFYRLHNEFASVASDHSTESELEMGHFVRANAALLGHYPIRPAGASPSRSD